VLAFRRSDIRRLGLPAPPAGFRSSRSLTADLRFSRFPVNEFRFPRFDITFAVAQFFFVPGWRLKRFRVRRQALPKRFHRLEFLFNAQLWNGCSNFFNRAHTEQEYCTKSIGAKRVFLTLRLLGRRQSLTFLFFNDEPSTAIITRLRCMRPTTVEAGVSPAKTLRPRLCEPTTRCSRQRS